MSIIPHYSDFDRRFRTVLREQLRRENDPQLLFELLAEVSRLPWNGKRVTGICRVSSRAQKARGYSLEGQEVEIRDYVKGQSFELDGLFDTVGSGDSWGRVREALDYAEKNGNAIVIPGWDRFSRQRAVRVAEECKRRQIRLIVLDDGCEVDPGEIASGVHQRSERSRNTKRGIKTRRRSNPKWGRRSLADDPHKWKLRQRIDELSDKQFKAGKIKETLILEGWELAPDEKTIRKYLRERAGKKVATMKRE